jgi:hypothetical protein
MLIHTILFKKEVTDNYGTRSFHYLNHRMPREPSVDKQLSTTFFVTTVIVIHQSLMACFLCCRFYSRGPLRENPYMVHNKHSSSRLCSKRKNIIFDTSATLKKSETRRRIFFFQNLTFFHSSSIIVWNFCPWKQLKK